MKAMDKRLRQLEQHEEAERLHVVMWSRGQSFDDALGRSCKPDDANGRLLIELVPVEGGHGQPIVPVEYPGNEGEMAKARAWAAAN